jgi:hypothetical protein
MGFNCCFQMFKIAVTSVSYSMILKTTAAHLEYLDNITNTVYSFHLSYMT